MPSKQPAPTASKYTKLDDLILDTIRQGRRSPLYDSRIDAEAQRIANATGREGFRVVDARIQALRQAGKIKHLSKAEAGKDEGATLKSRWRIVETEAQTIERGTDVDAPELDRPSA